MRHFQFIISAICMYLIAVAIVWGLVITVQTTIAEIYARIPL